MINDKVYLQNDRLTYIEINRSKENITYTNERYFLQSVIPNDEAESTVVFICEMTCYEEIDQYKQVQ